MSCCFDCSQFTLGHDHQAEPSMEPSPSRSSSRSTRGKSLSQKKVTAPKRSSAFSINDNSSIAFPESDIGGDGDIAQNLKRYGSNRDKIGRSFDVETLLEKVPQSVWQPNAVVHPHRRKANMYWSMLLLGYTVYIGLVSGTSWSGREYHAALGSFFPTQYYAFRTEGLYGAALEYNRTIRSGSSFFYGRTRVREKKNSRPPPPAPPGQPSEKEVFFFQK